MTDRLAAVGLRLLAPLARLLGPGDEDALQNADTTTLPDGSLVWVNDQLAVYVLHKQSAAPPSGVTVVDPASGPGRWIPLATSTSGGATIVADIATLEALAAPIAGAQAYVLSVRSGWTFEFGSALTPDGITVVADTGATGKWVRSTVPDRSWSYQGTWYLNATAGNDENSGGAAVSALKTWAEFQRRASNQTLQQNTFVHVMSDLDEDIVGSFALSGTNRLSIFGDPAAWVTTRTSSFTAVTPILRTGATPNAQQVTDGTVVSWAAEAGLRIRMTGAPAGATSWVAKDLGAGVARTAPFKVALDATTLASLPVANTVPTAAGYVVERLPGVRSVNLSLSNAEAVSNTTSLIGIIDSLEIGKNVASAGSVVCAFIRLTGSGDAAFTRCRMLGYFAGSGFNVVSQGCCYANNLGWDGGAVDGGLVLLGTSAASMQILGNASQLQRDLLLQGVRCVGAPGRPIRINAIPNTGVASFDSGGDAFELTGGDIMLCFAPVYGSGHADNGVQVETGTMLVYDPDTSIPNIYGLNQLTIAGVAYTWANVAAALNGTIYDAANACGVLKRLGG